MLKRLLAAVAFVALLTVACFAAGPIFVDRVQDTSTTTGTTDFVLSGTAPLSLQAWSTVGNGNTAYYLATDVAGDWEVGLGTYSSTGPTLARTTVLSSSTGSKISFPAGTKTISQVTPAAWDQGTTTHTFSNATTSAIFSGGQPLSTNGLFVGSTGSDWLAAYAYGKTGGGQIYSLNTIGGVAGVFASRTSDNTGGASIGNMCWGFNDNTSTLKANWACYMENRVYPSAGLFSVTAEPEITNLTGVTTNIDNYANLFATGGTANFWMGSGGQCQTATKCYDPANGLTDLVSSPASALMGVIANGSTFQKGIVFAYNSISGVDGKTAAQYGPAISMAMGQTEDWSLCANTTSYPTLCGTYVLGGRITSDATATASAAGIYFSNNGVHLKNLNAALTTGPFLTTINSVSGNNMQLGMIDGSNSEINANGGVGIELAVNTFIEARMLGATGDMEFAQGIYAGGLTQPTAGFVQIVGGSTSRAPISLTSGTNLTTAAAGAIEYDGKAIYCTAAASSRQVCDAEQVTVLSADNALTNVATAQNVFPTGQGTFTLQAGTTYEFDAKYEVDTTGATSNSLQTLFGGTATYTSIDYHIVSTNGTTATVPSAASMRNASVATAVNVTAAVAAATQRQVEIRGTMRVNAGGTTIPQVQYSAAPGAAPVVRSNSFFRLWPIGSNTVTAVGNLS